MAIDLKVDDTMSTIKDIISQLNKKVILTDDTHINSVVVEQDKLDLSKFLIKYDLHNLHGKVSLSNITYIKYYKYIIQVRHTYQEVDKKWPPSHIYWRHKRCNKDFYKEVPYSIKKALELYYSDSSGQYADLTPEEFLLKAVPKFKGVKHVDV